MIRKPDAIIDTHIAKRLKQRREDYGITQQALGKAIGISYQQIQKYEKYTDRISASRLYEIAWQLQVPVEWFFEGLEKR